MISKVKSLSHLVASTKISLILSILFIYGISFFFQYELSFFVANRDGYSVYHMAELTLPIPFLILCYAIYNRLFTKETVEISFALDKRSKLWYLPLIIGLFCILCIPLFIWYAISFDSSLREIINIAFLGSLYGSLFCLILFSSRQPILALVLVFASHLFIYLVLPLNRMQNLSMQAFHSNYQATLIILGLILLILVLARRKEKSYFE